MLEGRVKTASDHALTLTTLSSRHRPSQPQPSADFREAPIRKKTEKAREFGLAMDVSNLEGRCVPARQLWPAEKRTTLYAAACKVLLQVELGLFALGWVEECGSIRFPSR
jgi:hypothetical protein